MQTTSRYILLSAITLAVTSMLYFFCLVISAPVWLCIIVVLTAVVLLFRVFRKDENLIVPMPGQSLITIAALCIGVCLITKHANAMVLKYGGWDAWAMWNYHSRFLADKANWVKVFQSTESDHADYPLCLSGFLGFLNRLFAGRYTEDISFIVGYTIALAIPVLIFVEIVSRNKVIAILILYFFSQDIFFLTSAGYQYADLLLALFFLGAFICMDYAADKKMISLAAFLMGCCLWTKNEGVILVGIFVLIHADIFWRNFRYFISGFIFPLFTLITYKCINPVHNDMVSGGLAYTKNMLLEKARYKTVWLSLKANINEKFYVVKICLYLYAIVCALQRKLPGRQLLVLILCFVAYYMVYVITPRDIDWHLSTSQDRLLLQLMPATVYVIARKLSIIKFLLPQPGAANNS